VDRAGPPVDVEGLGEEGGDDQASPVGQKALIGELAHAGVHDRIAGPALLPRVETASRALPAAIALSVVVVGDVRPCRHHLVVEVTPAELPGELLEALALVHPREHLVGR
jgi:hypothetical protein